MSVVLLLIDPGIPFSTDFELFDNALKISGFSHTRPKMPDINGHNPPSILKLELPSRRIRSRYLFGHVRTTSRLDSEESNRKLDICPTRDSETSLSRGSSIPHFHLLPFVITPQMNIPSF